MPSQVAPLVADCGLLQRQSVTGLAVHWGQGTERQKQMIAVTRQQMKTHGGIEQAPIGHGHVADFWRHIQKDQSHTQHCLNTLALLQGIDQ